MHDETPPDFDTMQVSKEMRQNVQDLVELVKQLIKEQQYDGVALLFTSASESERNKTCLENGAALQLLHDVCLPQLNAANYEEQPQLYGCLEELLKLIAACAPAEELLLELLEMVEEQKSEYVFNTALRALQVVLLRLGRNKPRAMEWSLASVATHLSELPMPKIIYEGYDLEQGMLLEQEEQIQSYLMHLITVDLFYKPIMQDIEEELCETEQQTPIFRELNTSRRNVLSCFLFKLLDKPLALLDIGVSVENDSKCNTYTLQCVHSLVTDLNYCLGNAFYLLPLAEQKFCWPRRLDAAKQVYEQSCENIFMNEDKLSLTSLAVYFYMVFVEKIGYETHVPKLYAPAYIFESGLYLATHLLEQQQPALQLRALLIAEKVLQQPKQGEIASECLELEVHTRFCQAICQIVVHSPFTHLRQIAIKHLRSYILVFDVEGQYLVLKNLLRTNTHNGIAGYLAIIYKDLVASALRESATTAAEAKLPCSFSGQDFRSIFLNHICHLPQGAETDLVDNADKIISSLNAVRFFAINDHSNRTGFWDFLGELENNFLTPLRRGLDLSIAHYHAESLRIEKGLQDTEEQNALKLLDMTITNDSNEGEAGEKSGANYFSLSREQKLQIVNRHLCTFDLMRSLLARLNECVENSLKFAVSNLRTEAISSC